MALRADSTSSANAPSAKASAPKIALDRVSMSFERRGEPRLDVLQSISTTIGEGEFVSIIGPSGGGKTTLLSIIAGLTPPTSGRVLLDGEPVTGPDRRRGMVFQQDALFLWRTVQRNVEYGLEVQGVDRATRAQVARHYLQMVGLERNATYFPKELSGGMRKRVAIAMVFANNPEVLLMDEPFGSLDYVTKVGLQRELLRIWEHERKTTLFVTHDVEEAIFLSNRILVLAKGGIVDDVAVPFPYPRTDEIRLGNDMQRLRVQLWGYLE